MPGQPLAFCKRGALVGFQVVAGDRDLVPVGGKELVDSVNAPRTGGWLRNAISTFGRCRWLPVAAARAGGAALRAATARDNCKRRKNDEKAHMAFHCFSILQFAVNHREAVRRDGGDFAVMGDDDHCHPLFPVEPAENLEYLLPALLVQIARRLICQDQGGMVDQSPCNRNSLLLTTAQSAGPVLKTVPKADLLQPSASAIPALVGGDFHRVERESHILQGGERGNEMESLKDETDVFSPPQCELVLIQRADLLSLEENAA